MFTFDRSLTNSNMHGLFKLQKSALQKKKKRHRGSRQRQSRTDTFVGSTESLFIAPEVRVFSLRWEFCTM